MMFQPPPSDILGIPINTDFRKWLKIGVIMQDRVPLDIERPGLILQNLFQVDEIEKHDPQKLLNAAMNFYHMGREDRGLPAPPELLYHWDRDWSTIQGDFWIYARIDLWDEQLKMHWWKFKAIFDSLPPDSAIKSLMQTRMDDPSKYKGKEMAKARRELMERKRAAAVYPLDEYE